MIEPVALQNFFITFFSAAAVILFGAAYAALFAWARLTQHPRWMPGAYLCYGFLVVAVWVLANAANLNGAWSLVTALMLFGYLLAPHAIWHLCSATHRAEDHEFALQGEISPEEPDSSLTLTRKAP